MPKNTENLPITQDKPNISRKSLPLYKKVQYFVQGNRGWVVKTMGLFVMATIVLWIFLMQDKVIDIFANLTIFKSTEMQKITREDVVKIDKKTRSEIIKGIKQEYSVEMIPFFSTSLWQSSRHSTMIDKNGQTMQTRGVRISKVLGAGTLFEVAEENGDKYIVQIVPFQTVLELPYYLINENGEIYSYAGKGISQDYAKSMKTEMKLLISYRTDNQDGDIIKLDRVLLAD